MIVHTRTPSVLCVCSRCKEPGTQGEFIGTQAKRGSVASWYCLPCWGHMQALLTVNQVELKRAWAGRVKRWNRTP